ncbi:hypothetical protein J6590_058508 [Homalodisca vitripennis]|nr:hypothetical protein J6590_058508 [Homalodisca vitripennis]
MQGHPTHGNVDNTSNGISEPQTQFTSAIDPEAQIIIHKGPSSSEVSLDEYSPLPLPGKLYDIPTNPEKSTMKKVMTTEYNAAETSTSSIVRAENIQTAQRQLLQQTTVPPTVDGYHNKTSLVRTSTTLDMELAKNLEAFTLGEFKRSNLEQQTDGYHNKTSLVRTSTTLDMELAKNLEAFTLGEFKRSNLEQQTGNYTLYSITFTCLFQSLLTELLLHGTLMARVVGWRLGHNIFLHLHDNLQEPSNFPSWQLVEEGASYYKSWQTFTRRPAQGEHVQHKT